MYGQFTTRNPGDLHVELPSSLSRWKSLNILSSMGEGMENFFQVYVL